jgi:molybdopterin-containing oxidoreductase family iron-sulfur binding subunit
MGDGQQANNLGCKSFQTLLLECHGITMLLFLMLMQKSQDSNEIVANGGLNGSYANFTTADGLN